MRLVAFSLLCAASAFAQPAAADFIPANSKVVLGINLRSLIDAAQLPDLKTDSHSLPAMMLAQNGLGALDPLKDVDSILIASTGEGDQPPAVAIIRGRFAGLNPTDTKDPKGIVVRVDDSTLLAGPPDMVHAAMDRRGAALDPALAARVAALSAHNDFWGVGGKLENVDRFEFGASFQDGLALDAEFHVHSSEATKKLTESMKFFEAMMHGQKFNLQMRNNVVKISLRIPKEELKKAIAAGMKPQPVPKPPAPGKVVTRTNGETVSVTLPGGH